MDKDIEEIRINLVKLEIALKNLSKEFEKGSMAMHNLIDAARLIHEVHEHGL